ncbi:hypothetical protein KUF71_011316, partial [Frankliniella fusca]
EELYISVDGSLVFRDMLRRYIVYLVVNTSFVWEEELYISVDGSLVFRDMLRSE